MPEKGALSGSGTKIKDTVKYLTSKQVNLSDKAPFVKPVSFGKKLGKVYKASKFLRAATPIGAASIVASGFGGYEKGKDPQSLAKKAYEKGKSYKVAKKFKTYGADGVKNVVKAETGKIIEEDMTNKNINPEMSEEERKKLEKLLPSRYKDAIKKGQFKMIKGNKGTMTNLKPVPAEKEKSLGKLSTKIRNKMGYASTGMEVRGYGAARTKGMGLQDESIPMKNNDYIKDLI